MKIIDTGVKCILLFILIKIFYVVAIYGFAYMNKLVNRSIQVPLFPVLRFPPLLGTTRTSLTRLSTAVTYLRCSRSTSSNTAST